MLECNVKKTGFGGLLWSSLAVGSGLLALGGAAWAFRSGRINAWALRSGRIKKGRRLFPEMKNWYEARMKSLLLERNRELHNLRRRATTAGLSARTHLYRQIELLEGKLNQLESLLRELGHTSEAGWPQFRRMVERAFEDIRATFKELHTKFH